MLTFLPIIASLVFFMSYAGFLLNWFTFFLIHVTQFTRAFNTVVLKILQVALGFLPFGLLFLGFYYFCDFNIFPLLELDICVSYLFCLLHPTRALSSVIL